MFVEDVHAINICANQVDAGREVCLEKTVLGAMRGWVQLEVQNKDHRRKIWEFSYLQSSVSKVQEGLQEWLQRGCNSSGFLL